jgi:hypothetical protein
MGNSLKFQSHVKNVNKADIFQSQCYSYEEHFMLYLIFC